MHGASPQEQPGRYWQQIAIMKEMRWSWSELVNSPADLVEEVLMHIISERRWESKRADMDRKKANV